MWIRPTQGHVYLRRAETGKRATERTIRAVCESANEGDREPGAGDVAVGVGEVLE